MKRVIFVLILFINQVNSFGQNVGIGTTTPTHKLEVIGNIWLGTEQQGAVFTPIQDVLYLGSPRKYLSNKLGTSVDGSIDWINLMAHPLSSGIMLGLSGPSDADPHSVPNPLMVLRSNGNAGIGTTTPTARLEVVGELKITNSQNGLIHTNGTTTVGTFIDARAGWVGTNSNHPLWLYTNYSDAPGLVVTTGNIVGIGTTTPQSSAKLDVNSTTQGFLPPRMTYAERNAIASPAQGLIIYCTDCGLTGGEPQYYNGGYWANLAGEQAALPIPVISISNLTWMTKNLDVTTYRNGDPIPEVTDGTVWASLTTGAWCWYNNDPATYSSYGRLYNWYAVHDTRGLAPVGWSLAGPGDFDAIANCLGGISVAGGDFKEAGTSHWNSPNTGATNSFGFTALPAGSRSSTDGAFSGIGTITSWWTNVIAAVGLARIRSVFSSNTNILGPNSYIYYNTGLSVRCVKTRAVQLGDCLGSGIVAYIYQPGDPGYVAGEQHGIIAAPTDQSAGAAWGCATVNIGGTSTALGAGAANSSAILSGCGEADIAARICYNLYLNFNVGGWHLPSIDELQKLYINQAVIGGFSATIGYWSSTEFAYNKAWGMAFDSGITNGAPKNSLIRVRAVKYF